MPRWPEGAGGARLRRHPCRVRRPEEFPADVLAEAERRAGEPPLPELDATDVPLVTLDPVGSRDLDQAVHLAARGDGYRVSYAIADVGGVRRLGSAIDAEARRRGQTLYSPDRRTPLHPPVLSEGAASLLPDSCAPAVLWTIDLDADGEPVRVELRRARVRSRAQLDYPCRAGPGRRRDAARAAGPAARDRRAAGAAGRRARGDRAGHPEQEVVAARTAGGPSRCAATCRWRAGTRRSRCSPAAARPLMLDGGVGCCARCRRPGRRTSPASSSSRRRWASSGPPTPAPVR